ncbi:MAG: hypothetical protein CM1200mP18_00990 [Gammaproteobacteria bacterium]|nr:MAG: hypothetical protein CM1200mP18_00990 [Gammaproteobacteria bacterium]
MLTTSEIELYHEKGLIIPRDFRLPATEVECLRSAVDSVAITIPTRRRIFYLMYIWTKRRRCGLSATVPLVRWSQMTKSWTWLNS